MAFPENPDPGDTHTENGRDWVRDTKGRWVPSGVLTVTTGGGGGEVPTYIDHGNVTTTKTIDVTAASHQMITLTSSSCALTFSGTPASGEVNECVLIVKKDNNSTARAVTYTNAPEWPNDTAPFVEGLTANAETYIQVITYSDGRRRGFPAGVHFP